MLSAIACNAETPETPEPPRDTSYDTVLVPKAKTSAYVAKITLTMAPLLRDSGQAYETDYKVTVAPFVFFNESGRLRISFTDEQLARLERGERVEFSGDATNTKNKGRRVLGHAQADAPNARAGTIRVRVFVTKNTDLVFNTTYQFEDKPPEEPGE